ncbi:MAG: DUF3024 domain-containing protein [Mariprofundus sp.]|nr:DUF3024 domain-containing protein [Mariprofundus sp.]
MQYLRRFLVFTFLRRKPYLLQSLLACGKIAIPHALNLKSTTFILPTTNLINPSRVNFLRTNIKNHPQIQFKACVESSHGYIKKSFTGGNPMAFNELDLQRIKKHVGGFCEKRSAPHLSNELRLDYEIENQAVTIFEVRPHWRETELLTQTEIARISFVRSKRVWKLYWLRGDMKWYSYEPLPSSTDLQNLVTEIDKDPMHCFFG